MFPDTPTIVLMAVLLVTSLGLLLLWLWRCDRSLGALAYWGTAYLLVAVGALLLGARGQWPNRVTIDLAGALMYLAYGLGWMGCRRSEGRPISLPAACAGAAVWLIACRMPTFYDNLVARAATASIIIGTYDALCAREFLRHSESGSLRSRRALGILFAVSATVQGVRLLATLLFPFRQPAFSLPASLGFSLAALVASVFGAVTSVLLIAVAKERSEQNSIAILAAARDAADRANDAKSRFLARMSHELRTPLNTMLGMAQALVRDPKLAGVHQERAAMLEQSGRHLLAIINDVLDLAAAESGKFQFHPQPTLVRDLVRGSVDLVAGSAAAKRIELQVEYSADVPVAIHGDPLRIRQILVNLLGNAIKFTPTGGHVRLDVSPLNADSGLRLSVIDNGPGVAPEFRSRLFQDFAQRAVKDGDTGGTGLGLAISASLAQAMCGGIEYQPGTGGTGSVFTVSLPLRVAEPPTVVAPKTTAAAPAGRPLRVLVVDDIASNRKLAEVLLEQAGHSSILAENAEAAFAMLQAGPLPDVVLMDVHMPGIDGLAAARRIRAMPGRAGQVPVIAMTADAEPTQAASYYAAGMNGTITKPIEIDAFVAAITRVTGAPTAAPEPADAAG